MTSAGARKGLDQSAREIRCHGLFGRARFRTNKHDLNASSLKRLPGTIANAGTDHQLAIGHGGYKAGMTVSVSVTVGAVLAFVAVRLFRAMGTSPIVGPGLAAFDRIVLYIEDEKGCASAKMM